MELPIIDYVLDFQSTDFESDSKVVFDLFAEYQRMLKLDNEDGEKEQHLFRISQPQDLAGWSFAKLFLAGKFVQKIYEANSYEIELMNRWPKVTGKYYEGDLSVIKFVAWLGSKLKERNCKANVKIGEEMADVAYGEGAGAVGMP